jgi:ABC-type amino acid transport substrate-binding protein
MAAVADGEADAVLIDSISGRLYLKDEPALRQAGQPVTVEPFAFVVRIDDERLLEKLNESLAHLHASGQLDEIINKWLGK